MKDWKLKQINKLIEFGERVSKYDEEHFDFSILAVDDGFCDLLGYTRKELMVNCRGKLRELIYSPDMGDINQKVIEDLKRDGEYLTRFRIKRKSGDFIWVTEVGTLEQDLEGNRQVRSLTVNVDHIETMRQERSIMMERVPAGILHLLVTEVDFYILQANQECMDMFGTNKDEYIGSSGMFTFAEDLPIVRAKMIQAAKNKEPFECTFRCYGGNGDGEWYWLSLSGRFYDEQDDGKEYLCVFYNVTERKKHISQLELEREKYKRAMHLTSDFIFEYDLETRELSFFGDSGDNEYVPFIEEGIYKTGSSILKKNQLIHPEDFEKCRFLIRSRGRVTVQIRVKTMFRKTGVINYQWYEVEAIPVWRNNKIVTFVGSLRRLDELRKEERRQKELANIFEVQAQRTFEIVVYIPIEEGDIHGYLMTGNEFERVFPTSQFDEFVEFTSEQYVHPDEQERFRQNMQLPHMIRVLNQDVEEEMAIFRIKIGKEAEYRYKCIKYSYMSDDESTIIFTGQDMNQFYESQMREEMANRKILESAISERQTSAEIRRNFSLMISRELLAPIQFAEMCMAEGIQDNNREQASEAISYARKVMENIAEFQKIEQGYLRLENKKVELDRLLIHILENCKKSAGELGVDVMYQLNLQWKSYFGDERRIAQVIHNVLGNCLMASQKGARVNIWGHDEEQGDGLNMFHMTIEDTGTPVLLSSFGRDYLLEPKLQKETWRYGNTPHGAEFSLILARKILESMGGMLQLNRKKEQFNIIDIYFPLKKIKEAEGYVVTDFQVDSYHVDFSPYTLLLVENDEGREYLHGPMLRLNGAQVEPASNSEEAKKIWQDYPKGKFHAILVNGNRVDKKVFELVKWFRSQEGEEAKNIPIFVFADDIGQDIVRESMRVGINSILPCSVDLKRLKKVFEMMIKNC